MKLLHLSTLGMAAALLLVAGSGCEPDRNGKSPLPQPGDIATEPKIMASEKTPSPAPPGGPAASETATFGGGCFWCLEAVFQQLGGVEKVTSGYMGGTVRKPSYEQICTGSTGHAEVVQVKFDPARISYEKLLEYFWKLHDPTTLNRQGNDVGTQYRSAIFYHSEAQQESAEKSKKARDASGAFSKPIVTEIVKAVEFYPAEDYHQNYYRDNRDQPYCRYVIAPKLDKMGMEK